MPEVITKSKSDLQDILEIGTVDVGNGTLFGASQKRPVDKSRLRLVISTGGSGLSAIKAAISDADQKLNSEYRSYTKFVVIDSDSDAVNGIQNQSYGITAYNTYDAGATRRYDLNVRSAYARSFMPADYDLHLINPFGSSQDRMTGKLKLYDAPENGTNDVAIAGIIRKLILEDWAAYTNLDLDIIILTGISGGNGSGTFMDLAAIARKAYTDSGATGTATIYGYIMLPDTADKFASTPAAKKTLYRNGYAALKELESYMSQPFMPKRIVKLERPDPTQTTSLNTATTLFDYVVLLSGNYDDDVQIIAETLVNSMADNGANFSQKSFYSNIMQARAMAFSPGQIAVNGILKPDACPEDSHMYSAIGYAKASVPEKIIIPNTVGSICSKIFNPPPTALADGRQQIAWCDTERKLWPHEFVSLMKNLFGFADGEQLTSLSLWKKVEAELHGAARLPENEYDIDLNGILSGDGIDTYRDGYNVETRKLEATKQLHAYCIQMYQVFVKNASAIMQQYGPRVLEYLYTGEGNLDKNTNTVQDFSEISIRTMLLEVETKLQALGLQHMEEPQKPDPLSIIEKAKEALSHQVEYGWKQAFEEAVQYNLFTAVARDISGPWRTATVEKIENFYECAVRFADVIELMKDYYIGAGKQLDTTSVAQFINAAGDANAVNICSDAAMVGWVKNQVNMKLTTVNLQNVKDALVGDFILNTQDWVSIEKGKARKRFDEIMSQSCAIGVNATVNNGFNLSVMDYFEQVLDGVPTAAQQTTIDQTVSGIMQKLLQASKPAINTQQGAFCMTNRTIIIPKNLTTGPYGGMVQQSFQTFLRPVGGGQANVMLSDMEDGIVCFQTSVGHALSSLRDIATWEAAYEETCNNSTHLNNGEYETPFMEQTASEYAKRHMETCQLEPEMDRLCGVGLSWEHYPSLNVMAYGNEFDRANTNTREANYRSTIFNARIKKALEWHLIEVVKEQDRYQYFVNLIPDDWDNLSTDGYDNLERGKYVRGESLFQFIATQNQHSKPIRERVCLTGNAFFDNPFDFSTIIQAEQWTDARIEKEHVSYMKRIMRKNTWLYQELLKTMRRYVTIETELAARERVAIEQYRMTTFVDLYLYGIISKVEDEDETEWKIRVKESGAVKVLETFDIFTEMSLTGVRSKLYQDDLILAMLYPKFLALNLDLDELVEVRNAYFQSMAREDAKKLLMERKKALGEFKDKFEEVFGLATSKKNPIDVICSVYELEKKDRNQAQELYMLYTIAKKKAK